MAKWADYLICAVQPNIPKKHIETVSVRPDLGDSAGVAKQWQRSEVVAAIESANDKKTFVTVTAEGGVLKKGKEVKVVKINGTKYLQTVSNNIEKDNLDNLPNVCPAATKKG